MGITADHGVCAHFTHQLPEGRIGIMATISGTQQVDLQRCMGVHGTLDQAAIVATEYGLIAYKSLQIGMGYIGEKSRVQSLADLIYIVGKIVFFLGFHARIPIGIAFVIQVVLTQDEIIAGILPDKGKGILEDGWIIFYFVADLDLDPVFIGFPESREGHGIFLGNFSGHTETGIIVSLKHLGCVVRETKGMHTALDGVFDIFWFGTSGVTATRGMGMIIEGEHGKRKPDFRF